MYVAWDARWTMSNSFCTFAVVNGAAFVALFSSKTASRALADRSGENSATKAAFKIVLPFFPASPSTVVGHRGVSCWSLSHARSWRPVGRSGRTRSKQPMHATILAVRLPRPSSELVAFQPRHGCQERSLSAVVR